MSSAHAATLAATALTLHTAPSVLPSWSELMAILPPAALLPLLLSRRLLLPLDRMCPKGCSMQVVVRVDTRYTDGVRLRCNRCDGDWSVRHGSVLQHSKASLGVLMLALQGIEQRLAMAQISRMSRLCFDSVSTLWRDVRQRMYLYMEAHPVLFDEDDIVEIDECHLKMLQKLGDKPVWIIGMIARGSGRVALEIAQDHTMKTMRLLINKHLVRSTTISITDRHKSFGFLEFERRHFWAEKRKGGRSLWVEVDDILLLDHFGPGVNAEFGIHSNTIEGLWSHMRRELRGAQVSTVHLYLAEIMFRRLGIPILEGIRV